MRNVLFFVFLSEAEEPLREPTALQAAETNRLRMAPSGSILLWNILFKGKKKMGVKKTLFF